MLYNSAMYDKTNPFFATITERVNLCSSTSNENTIHLVLNLKGSGITYEVGDSIAIQPINDSEIVETILSILEVDGNVLVTDKQGVEHSFGKFLKEKCNLLEISRKFLSEIYKRQNNAHKKQILEQLLAEGQKEAFKAYQISHSVADTLNENQELILTPQELVQFLMPLLPRFYSISSAMSAVGEEVHLTIAEVVYEVNGQIRRGTCTHYLCNLVPLHVAMVPVYIQPSHGFVLPENDHHPIIMIGPGTGVAPFRAFMQERQARGAGGRNWLFFGEKHEDHHFYYRDYWQQLVSQGKMRLETAFSRDQEHKIYVQHRLLECGEELFEWMEQGAHLYVCGDAQNMAKDVDAALHKIIQSHGKLDELGTKAYIKRLKQEKRYLRDVY